MTKAIDKKDIQYWLRTIPWCFHLVLDEQHLKITSDENALRTLRKLNFLLCKHMLGRRFCKYPIEHRFHWTGFFQGSRDAGTRHLHILLHVPGTVRSVTPFERLRLRAAITSAWLKVKRRDETPFLWARSIADANDNAAVATYVSRYCSAANWNAGEVHFSG